MMAEKTIEVSLKVDVSSDPKLIELIQATSRTDR